MKHHGLKFAAIADGAFVRVVAVRLSSLYGVIRQQGGLSWKKWKTRYAWR